MATTADARAERRQARGAWRGWLARRPFRVKITMLMAFSLVLRILYVRATWDYVPHFLLDTATYTAHALYLWQRGHLASA